MLLGTICADHECRACPGLRRGERRSPVWKDKTAQPLLDSKLRPLLGARRPVARPRLGLPDDLLADHAKAVTVTAPAGYGKSMLMAQWFESLRRSPAQDVGCAWLNLDENDNDPLRLLRNLIAALQRAAPALRGDAALDFQAPLSSRALLDVLGARLAAMPGSVLLFIDDAHLLADSAALQVLEWLIRYAADNLRFVVGARQPPRVGLSEIRLRGELIEFEQSDLAFTSDEAASLWRQRCDGPLDGPTLAALLEKTEGWAAAIELLTLALDGEADAGRLVADFSASERGVVDYLSEAVFGKLSEPLREQIHRLAQFDRFCAELAVQACGPEVPGDLLDELQRRRLFLIPLDRQRRWFRFHHLVRDYLRRPLPAGLAEATRQTLIAGGHWFRARGMADDAIDCAVRAQAWDLACQWLAASIDRRAPGTGLGPSVARWMPLIPRAQIDRYPEIRVGYLTWLVFLQERGPLEREMANFEASIDAWERAGDRDPRQIDALRCASSLNRMMWRGLRDDGLGALPQAQQWLARWPQASPRLLGNALTLAAYAAKTAGEIDLGLQYAARAREADAERGDPFVVSRSLLLTSLLWLKRGDYGAALASGREGLRVVAERLNQHPEQIAYHHAVLAAVYYEADDAAQAGRELRARSWRRSACWRPPAPPWRRRFCPGRQPPSRA